MQINLKNLNKTLDNHTNKWYDLVKKGSVNMEKPVIVYQKNVDKTANKMIIPKKIVEQWGYQYLMEIYPDRIVLKPISKRQ